MIVFTEEKAIRITVTPPDVGGAEPRGKTEFVFLKLRKILRLETCATQVGIPITAFIEVVQTLQNVPVLLAANIAQEKNSAYLSVILSVHS